MSTYRNSAACVAVLILRNGRVLLARRGVEPAKGQWDTVGGFVDENESAEEAVARETLEETGLQVNQIEYLGSVPDQYGINGKPILHLCFAVNVVGGGPVAKSDVASLVWFPIDELPVAMAFPNQSKVLALLKNKLPVGESFSKTVETIEPE